MTIDVSDFKGEAPRLAPRSLPNQMGQNSENARLLSGDVDTWYGFSESTTQPIVVDPLTIYYLAEEVWLTFNSTPNAGGNVFQKLWESNLGTPFWVPTVGDPTFISSVSNLIPAILGNDGNVIRIIDYKTGTVKTATAGPIAGPPVGDGDIWQVDPVNGGTATSRAAGAQEAAIFGSAYFGSPVAANYPGVGNYMAAWQANDIVCELANGLLVLATWRGFAITGGVSTSGTAGLFTINPVGTQVVVYDIIPALSGSPGYLNATFPCADGVHLIVLTGAVLNAGATAWHLVACGAAGATEIATGAWSTGPEALNGNPSDVGGGSSDGPTTWSESSESTIAMLESFTATATTYYLWLVCGGARLGYCLSLTNGSNYTVIHHWDGTGTNFCMVQNQAAHGVPSSSVWADAGQCAILIGNYMAMWQRAQNGATANVITASEADIEKAAISGDVSFRTYFCGTDAPRFTDIGLASGLTAGGNPVTGSASLGAGFPGNGPFPIYSRKIGVPNPTFVPTVTLVQASAGSTISTLVENFNNPVQWTLSTATLQDSNFASTGGYPAGDALHLQSIGGEAYGYKNFAVDPTQAVTMEVEFALSFAANCYQGQGYLDFYVGMDASGQGTCIRVYINSASSAVAGSSNVLIEFCPVTGFVIGAALSTTTIASGSIPTWNGSGYYIGPFQGSLYNQAVITIGAPSAAGVSAMSITIKTVNGAGNFVTATGLTASYASCPNNGSTYGVQAFTAPGNSIPYWFSVNYDNFTIIGTTPLTAAASEATAYVYTLLNDLGEESGPSPASAVITRNLGYGVNVTLPASLSQAGVDYTYFQGGSAYIPKVQNAISFNPGGPSPGINLYRLVTSSSGGTQFLLVASDLPMGQTYLDIIADSALSEVIPSYFTLNGVIGTWDVPPTNMLGILALPNGIYAGFFGNTICLSAQGIPHAWPLIFQQTVDYPIVGIAAVDAAVMICTEKFPYVFYGQTPDAYSATKVSYPHACASKKSIANVKGAGVAYATFEGLVAIPGTGKEIMLTEQLFTKREWQALNPSSMIAVVNDNRYFCFYSAGGYAGGFYIDMDSQRSAGKVSLGFHAYTRFNDPLSDNLYLVLDEDYLGLDISLNTIVTFDSDTLNPLPFVWKSKQFYVDHPLAYSQCRVKSDSYANTTITLFADGQAYATLPVTSGNEFAIPRPPNGVLFQYFEFQIQGTDRVNRVQFVEDGQEWT